MISLEQEEYRIKHELLDAWPYVQTVSKPWGVLEPMLEWCKSEMVSEWRWQLVDASDGHRPGRYVFYFKSGLDCTAFSLKWC